MWKPSVWSWKQFWKLPMTCTVLILCVHFDWIFFLAFAPSQDNWPMTDVSIRIFRFCDYYVQNYDKSEHVIFFVNHFPCSYRKYWLKVPKSEIFDCSDFHDFYTIKEGDFGEKKFRGSFGTAKFTTGMLSLIWKVPKCEIFHLFDFNDFYGIKSL